MRLPNLLATKRGRLAAFFCLYVTEGIPLGFTATALATQMRRQGVEPDAIGAFVGSLYLPWAFKWAIGPLVDTVSFGRFGHRRVWIASMQVLMAATLLSGIAVDYVAQLTLFSAIIFLHNAFGATQDVAIDALACNVLHDEERGLANGLMFAGASVGQAIGGPGVLFLARRIGGFQPTFYFVAACILAVTVFIALPMREQTPEDNSPGSQSGLRRIAGEIQQYLRTAWQSFFFDRAALLGVVYSLLPAGSYALGLALQTNLAVELGLNDDQVAVLNLVSTVVFAVSCVGGGFVSDRFGRRSTLAIYTVATSLPAAWLGALMLKYGWVMPVNPTLADRPVPAEALIGAFWTATIAYNVLNGLMYGTRSALMMDITTPAVAATQFTAYMALQNLAISYTAAWQGESIVRWGYPTTLFLDAVVGLVGLSLLPLMAPRPKSSHDPTAS